jgi:hypothetical protein
LCAAAALPGLLLLFKIAPWNADNRDLETGYNPMEKI